MNDFWVGFAVAVVLSFCFFTGWKAAHNEVANECKLQGIFYVGQTVYNCSVKEIEK